MQEIARNHLYEPEKVANLKELINRSSKLYADHIAFKYKLNPKSDKVISVTYSQFKANIDELGTALLNLGLANKRIAIIAPNRYEWCVSYLAITTGNMVVIPLDKSLPDNEIESSIIRSKADAVIFDQKYLDVFQKIKQEKNSHLQFYICMDSIQDVNDILSYSALLKNGKQAIEKGDNSHIKASIDNEKMSIMLFTSGTTSIAKIVALSHKNLCSNVYQIGCVAHVTEKDTFLSFLPLHHTFESSTTFLYGLYCGITIAFCDGLRYVVNNLKEYKVTGFVCVPLMLEAMYKKVQKGIKEQNKETLVNIMTKLCNFLLKFRIDIRRKVFKSILDEFGGHLRVIVYGGAPMDKKTILGFTNLGINMLHGYGLTETSPVASSENDKYKKTGSVAFPVPDAQIKIDNPNEDGVGEVLIKGPNVMLGYYDNEEATKEALQNGWFHSGDLGYYDKDGYLFLTGRKKSVIVLKNGKNIYPEELEILLARLPYVVENIVYGKPDKDGDLKICAKIVYQADVMKEMFPDKTKEEYHAIIWEQIKKINKTIPTYKYIRELIITEEPLIKTTTQKVKRHEEIKRILEEEKKN